MKTDRIFAVGEKSIVELSFNKVLDYPEEVWLRLCQKHYTEEKISKVYDARTHHLCKYCGGIADGIDENILCQECREDFGHAFFTEL